MVASLTPRLFLIIHFVCLAHALSSPYPPAHTMTIYPGPSLECEAKQVLRGLRPADQKLLVNLHNSMRERKAGVEEKVTKLVWNEELARIAQRWGDQCTFGHDNVRVMADGVKEVGQYVFLGYNLVSKEQDARNGPLERQQRHIEIEVGVEGDPYVRVNLGDVHAKTMVGDQFEVLMNDLGVFEVGTSGILTKENSNFGLVEQLLEGLRADVTLGDKLEKTLGGPKVETTSGEIQVELLPRDGLGEEISDADVDVDVDVDVDDPDYDQQVACLIDRQGKHLVVEVGVSGDCHDITVNFGDVHAKVVLGDQVEELMDDLGVVEKGTRGILTEENSNISLVEELFEGLQIEVTLGDMLKAVLGNPQVDTNIGEIQVEFIDEILEDRPVEEISKEDENSVAEGGVPEGDGTEGSEQFEAWLADTITRAVVSWFEDQIRFRSFTIGGRDYISNRDYYHFRYPQLDGSYYTHLSWPGTTDMGCGLSLYQESDFPDWVATLVVCNYAAVPATRQPGDEIPIIDSVELFSTVDVGAEDKNPIEDSLEEVPTIDEGAEDQNPDEGAVDENPTTNEVEIPMLDSVEEVPTIDEGIEDKNPTVDEVEVDEYPTTIEAEIPMIDSVEEVPTIDEGIEDKNPTTGSV